ncbi:MAG: hypothetical protein K1X44_03780 [Alphaproteobacteria bacterium]|nr:hypothetical protein [Alphaproteobacteria bacterium]
MKNKRAQVIFYITIFCVLICALLLRFLLIEPRDIGIECTQLFTWVCAIRKAIIDLFVYRLLGITALILAILAYKKSLVFFAKYALILSICGLVLYNPELSSVAFVLSFLKLV